MPAKETVHEILDRLPDDTTLEEIEYQIYRAPHDQTRLGGCGGRACCLP